MMKVKVLKTFLDKQNKVIQPAGKIIDLSEKRIEEIKAVRGDFLGDVEENPEFPKHTGGGWYELSNGEKIKGKDEAIEAENELKTED